MGTCANAPGGWCDDLACVTNGCKHEPRPRIEIRNWDSRAKELTDFADIMESPRVEWPEEMREQLQATCSAMRTLAAMCMKNAADRLTVAPASPAARQRRCR